MKKKWLITLCIALASISIASTENNINKEYDHSNISEKVDNYDDYKEFTTLKQIANDDPNHVGNVNGTSMEDETATGVVDGEHYYVKNDLDTSHNLVVFTADNNNMNDVEKLEDLTKDVKPARDGHNRTHAFNLGALTNTNNKPLYICLR